MACVGCRGRGSVARGCRFGHPAAPIWSGGGLVVLSLAKATKDYYLQMLGEVSSREDYYLRGGTAVGVWTGSGAAELGLSGSVTAEGLVRLFDEEHPGTGEQLVAGGRRWLISDPSRKSRDRQVTAKWSPR